MNSFSVYSDAIKKAVNALASSHYTKLGGCLQFQYNFAQHVKAATTQMILELKVIKYENNPNLKQTERKELNEKAFSDMHHALFETNEIANDKPLRVIFLAIINPFDKNNTYEHRSTLWKVKDEQTWKYSHSFRKDIGDPEKLAEIPPETVQIENLNNFELKLRQIFDAPKYNPTVWNSKTIGHLYANDLCQHNELEVLHRKELDGIYFAPVLIVETIDLPVTGLLERLDNAREQLLTNTGRFIRM